MGRFMLFCAIDGRQIIGAGTLHFPPQLCDHWWYMHKRALACIILFCGPPRLS